MRRSAAFVIGILGLTTRLAVAQSGGIIRGVVRDSAARLMPNSDILVVPTGRRMRTDSAGRFSFDGLDGGQYTVRARHVGYGPTEWTVDLSKGGKAEIQLVLGARIVALDTVFVNDGRPCEPQKYEGFVCRRATA